LRQPVPLAIVGEQSDGSASPAAEHFGAHEKLPTPARQNLPISFT
jgi:hypothetical protein